MHYAVWYADFHYAKLHCAELHYAYCCSTECLRAGCHGNKYIFELKLVMRVVNMELQGAYTGVTIKTIVLSCVMHIAFQLSVFVLSVMAPNISLNEN